jgi:hypothetical protein
MLRRDAALAGIDGERGLVHRSSRTSILVPVVPTAIFNSILGNAGSQRSRLRTKAVLRRVSGKIGPLFRKGTHRVCQGIGVVGIILVRASGVSSCAHARSHDARVRTPSGHRVAAHIDFQQCGAQGASRFGLRRAGGAPLRFGRSRRLR